MVDMNVTDPMKELINPAVNGTTSLMNSAIQHGKKIKRVVITSSFACELSFPDHHRFI